jgi:serine/threonine protein kinase
MTRPILPGMTTRFLPLLPDDPTEVANYVLRARLGSGGMGTVYLSFSRGGRPVAIKLVRQDLADDPDFRRRFAREVAAAQRVQGHYTTPVVDADPDAPVPWFVTAYIAGPSLQRAVAESGPFPVFSVFRLLAGAAEGVAAVHAAGLVHRDLKPANVLLAEDGPRVIDFGIAYAVNSVALTGQGGPVGTPGYMAPEQFGGRIGPATDVFGLGQLALYAATGHAAFGAETTEALRYRILHEAPYLDDCPRELWPLVQRCLEKHPANRPHVTEVMDYARDAMHGDTMRVLNEPWLPPRVAETLPNYAPGAAPTLRPSRPLPVTVPATRSLSTVSPAGAPPAVDAARPRRWRSRLSAAVSAVVLLGAATYLGYWRGEASVPPGNGGKPLQTSPTSASTSPAGPGLANVSGFTEEWHSTVSMSTACPQRPNGYNPSAAAFFPQPDEALPQLGFTLQRTGSDSFGPGKGKADLAVACGGEGNPTDLKFEENRGILNFSAGTNPAECKKEVTTKGEVLPETPLKNLRVGETICMNFQTGKVVALVTVQKIDNPNAALTLSVSDYYKP